MFDTKVVGNTIRQARMNKNMTQLDLADAMGVSYQAVSNWERGNSMPDISKLEDLCRVLDLTLGSLLGAENQATVTVEKVLDQEPLTADELAEVAPMIPPRQMQEQLEWLKDTPITIEALTAIAPFLDDEMITAMLDQIQVDSLTQLIGIAPFLGEEALDALVRKAPMDDAAGIHSLAAFLSEDTLDYVVQQYEGNDPNGLLDKIAVFLSEESIDRLVEKAIAGGNFSKVVSKAPFMSTQSVRKLAKACMAAGDLETLKKISIFM